MWEEGGSQERRGRSRGKARSPGQRAQERAGLAKRRATSALGLPRAGSNHFCRHRPLPLRSGLALKEPLQILSHRSAGVGKWCGKGRQGSHSGQRGFPAGARHKPLRYSRLRGPGLARGRPKLASAWGRGASWALPSLTYPDSRPSRQASWTCRCGRCGSLPTSAHSPPGTGARPEPAPPASAGPPECGAASGRTVRASV